LKGHDITVVFDGWKSGGAAEENLVTGGIRVIYSRLGEKADAVIKRIICTDKKEWVVITSDREIVLRAWSCGSVPVSSEKFRSLLERLGEIARGEFESLDEDGGTLSRKGRARTPSRKEKTLLRVLKKL
jgi:predicted RNA-binding protein with PIN domain